MPVLISLLILIAEYSDFQMSDYFFLSIILKVVKSGVLGDDVVYILICFSQFQINF